VTLGVSLASAPPRNRRRGQRPSEFPGGQRHDRRRSEHGSFPPLPRSAAYAYGIRTRLGHPKV